MAKSTSQPKPSHGHGTKGDGGRNVPKPSNNPPTSQPGKSRSNEGAPGIKPPKSGGQ